MLARGDRRDRRRDRVRAAGHGGQRRRAPQRRARASRCCIPQGRIESRSSVEGAGADARIQRAALVRTARKILQGDLHIPPYVFSKPTEGDKPMKRLIAPAVAAALAAAAPLRDGLPRQDHHDRRAHRGRRRQRRDGAHHRAEARAAAGPDGHHRQPRRRQRRDRQRVRRPRRAGRPHADVRLHRHACDEPGAAEAALRPGGRLRADRPGRLLADADGRQRHGAGEGRQGPGGAAQGQARQVHLRVGRQRHRAALRGRAVQAQRRRRDAAACRTRARRRRSATRSAGRRSSCSRACSRRCRT